MCANLEQNMFLLVLSRHGITCDITNLDLTCVAVPPIRLVLLGLHCITVGGYIYSYKVQTN